MADTQPKQWLPLGWKVMAGWGFLNMAFAIFVPLTSLFVDPTMFVYAADDEKLTGASWRQIVALNPSLGVWIVLTMVSMCAMMMGFAILHIQISRKAYRRGERWAWLALLVANLLMVAYYVGIFSIYASHGLYGMNSGVNIGVPFLVIWSIVLLVGLWLPRKELAEARGSA